MKTSYLYASMIICLSLYAGFVTCVFGAASPSAYIRNSSTTYNDSSSGFMKVRPASKQTVKVQVADLDYSNVVSGLSAAGTSAPTMTSLNAFIAAAANECKTDGTESRNVCYVTVKASASSLTTQNIAMCPMNYFVVVSTGSSINDASNTSSSNKSLIYTPDYITQIVNQSELAYYPGEKFECDVPSKLKTNDNLSQTVKDALPADTASSIFASNTSWGSESSCTWWVCCGNEASVGSNPAGAQQHNKNDITYDGSNLAIKVTNVTNTGTQCYAYSGNGNDCGSPCSSSRYSGCCGQKYVGAWKYITYTYEASYIICARSAGFYTAPTSTGYNMPTASSTPYSSPTTVVCGKMSYGSSYWKGSDESP